MPGSLSTAEGSLRVLVVAYPSPHNEYILGRLVKVAKVEKLLAPVWPHGPRRTVSWAYQRLRAAPLATAAKPGREAVLLRLEARLDRRVAKHLPKEEPSIFTAAERISTSDLNGDLGLSMLRDIAPDLMILSGAPLLQPRIFSLPSLGTVNVHWGISPNYRGQESIFTALRHGDYASIGATLHYLDEGIDTGPALAQCWPSLDPTDDLGSIWAKTARLVATMLTDFVDRLRLGAVSGQRLSGTGILVRARDCRVWHHIDYTVQRNLLHKNPPNTQGRIVRYW